MATDATLALLRQALATAGNPAELAKNATFSQPTSPTIGLQTYNLEGPAKNLYPVLSPIRNSTPCVKATGGMQANWKAVTGINTGNLSVGVGEGQRGGIQSVSTAEFFAAFRTIGVEASVTEEADLSAEGYDDLRARAANTNLQTLMIEEEKIIVGGFSAIGLGVTPAPTLTTATVGGSIAAATTVSVICVALTMDGVKNANPIINGNVTVGIVATLTRTNADGTTTTYGSGAAQRSAAVNLVTGGGATNLVNASVPAVRGAAGYAWFAGPVGNEQFAGITYFSQTVITALPANGATAAALGADNSKNVTVFDGLLSLNANPSSAAYWYAAAPGATLTPDGAGGIAEFEALLEWYYDNLRASPTKIWVSSQEQRTIKKIILAAGVNQPSRFIFQIQQGSIVGGGIPKGYQNSFASSTGGNAEIPLEVHPYLPKGTIVFAMDGALPYPMNNVNNIMQILSRKDYHQREWPQITRAYQYGVYSDEVLQHYFPVSIAVISNLAPG